MGVRKGLPDMVILWRDKCLWLELKAPGGYATEEQFEFIERARAAGQQASIARTLEDVWWLLKEAGIPRQARPA